MASESMTPKELGASYKSMEDIERANDKNREAANDTQPDFNTDQSIGTIMFLAFLT